MSEALPLGLNYGHFGEPSYDIENHEWHFPRESGRTRELKLIGQPVKALQSSLHVPTARVQSATERAQSIKGLTQQYPELLPASSLLPGLAQVSEVIDDITSSYDPTMSELLAFGEAVDSENSKGRGLETVSIAAVAGGDAGEAVRLVLLKNEKLGWEGSKYIRLNAFSAKGGEEGWWSDNSTPIQQLVFAEVQGRPSSWLAVRYHRAISVLRPELHRNANIPPFAYATTSDRNFPSRLTASHVVTLPIDRKYDAPYSDVAFNPWYHQQLATVDQKGFWAVWDIDKEEKQAKGKRFWTVKRVRDGRSLDGLPEKEMLGSNIADGWGLVLWAGDISTIVVASRRTLMVFDISGSPKRLVAPKLVSSSTSEWILDVKRSSKDPAHVFVTTTSSIFWLQVISAAGTNGSEEVAGGAKCLLFWRHFRDPEDISLRIAVADDPESEDFAGAKTTSLVLLYSRSTGLVSVFTFHYARSHPNGAPSASDPYLLKLPNEASNILTLGPISHVSHRSSKISTMILRAVKYQTTKGSVPFGLGQIYLEKGVMFYQLSLLTNDLALSECLCAEVHNEYKAELSLPRTVGRFEVRKTPIRVQSDFIVPDGFVERDYGDLSHNPRAKENSDAESRTNVAAPQEDSFTISFEWLENEIHTKLTNTSPTIAFHEHLELLQNKIEKNLASRFPAMDSLFRINNTKISVLDLDKASGDFVDFLDDVRRMTSEPENDNDEDEGRHLMVSTTLTQTLQAALGFHDTAELSSIYKDLIQTWIVPMSRQIPSRVRIGLEKTLRDMAGQICLASYAMRIGVGVEGQEEEDPSENREPGARFVLPVRRRASATSLGKGKERLDAMSSPPPASSQISEDAGFMSSSALAALPTPEPTPSLRSQSSVSSLASSEDPASQRLRAYTTLAPQPALPAKMANLLGHWQVGVDPAKYDWESIHQAAVTKDEGADELQKKKHQKAAKRHKKQHESTVGPSSQPTTTPFGGSQPQQGQHTQATQGSSQQMEGAVTMSQVEPGKFGGRHFKVKKLKERNRPAGFK